MSRNINSYRSNGPAKVVLAVSQDISTPRPDDCPATDFERLAEALSAVVVGNAGHEPLSPRLKRLEDAMALDISQALHIVRTFPDADAYVSFSERVGIPLGLLLRSRRPRPAHVLIAHRLNTRAKRWLDRLTQWHGGVDRVITLCGAQLGHAEEICPGGSVLVRQGIDERFYGSPAADEDDFALSVGSENRDYETLIEAVSKIDIRVDILSSSPWCRKKTAEGRQAGEHVRFLPRVSYTDLRELYRRARLVIVPLHDVDYAAGINGLLEAFCASKPAVVSASRGIVDYTEHLRNAYVVPPEDVEAMASAIAATCIDADLREGLRIGAKRAVCDYANLGAFVGRLQSEIVNAIEKE